MVIKLSSKGQIVIPKQIRNQLALQSGATFHVEVVGDEIHLRPRYQKQTIIDAMQQLRGAVADADLVADLENERQRERERDVISD